MLYPLGNKIQIELETERQDVTSAGIIIQSPKNSVESGKHMGRKGKVIAIGPDVKEIKVGETVLWGEFEYKDYQENGKKYQLIPEPDICAVLE